MERPDEIPPILETIAVLLKEHGISKFVIAIEDSNSGIWDCAGDKNWAYGACASIIGDIEDAWQSERDRKREEREE